jgi:hypothetical protein
MAIFSLNGSLKVAGVSNYMEELAWLHKLLDTGRTDKSISGDAVLLEEGKRLGKVHLDNPLHEVLM